MQTEWDGSWFNPIAAIPWEPQVPQWLRQSEHLAKLTSCLFNFWPKFNRLNEHSLWLKFECVTFMIAKWCQFLPTRPLILFLFFVSFPKYIKHMTLNHDNLLETQCYSHVRPGLCESPHKMGQTLTVLKLTQVTCLDCKWAIYHAYTDETLWRVRIILMLFGWMSDRFWLPSLQ